MKPHESPPVRIFEKLSMRKLLFLLTVIALIGILGVPLQESRKSPIKKDTMLIDILSFNAAIVGYSLLSSGYSSGVGLELKQNGEVERGVGEFFRFWDYEYRIPSSKMDFKRKNLLIAHPLIGYQFSNYLLAKGYTKKRALRTTGLGVYLLEKGIQGSFETPSVYDLLSYFTGAVVSVLAQNSLERLSHKHFLLKSVAVAFNPFILLHDK